MCEVLSVDFPLVIRVVPLFYKVSIKCTQPQSHTYRHCTHTNTHTQSHEHAHSHAYAHTYTPPTGQYTADIVVTLSRDEAWHTGMLPINVKLSIPLNH